jgi:hypothetical protein
VGGYVGALKSEFTDKWNDSWDKHYSMMAANSVVFADNYELDYRKYIRPQIELLVREVFPSVAR